MCKTYYCVTHVTWQPVHVDALGGEADAHIAIATLANDLHLEVVETAGGRNGVRGSHTRCVLVSLSVPCNKQISFNILPKKIKRQILA